MRRRASPRDRKKTKQARKENRRRWPATRPQGRGQASPVWTSWEQLWVGSSSYDLDVLDGRKGDVLYKWLDLLSDILYILSTAIAQ